AVWSPDGSTIALAGYGGLRLLDRDLRVRTILDPSGPYPAFTPDGTKLVSVGSAMTVWDAATGVPLRRSDGDVHTELASLTVDDRHVVAIDVARGGTAWDIETG